MNYFFLSLLIYTINVVPGFMPPSWTILAYFYIHTHTLFLMTVVLGALFATLGRFTLYYLSKKYFYRLFSRKSQENFKAVGMFLNKKQKISIPLFFLYLFMPFPSNQLFIGAGIANMKIGPLLVVFFLGRLVSYSIWISSSKFAVTNLAYLFQGHITKTNAIIINIAGFVLLYLFSLINWKKILLNNKKK